MEKKTGFKAALAIAALSASLSGTAAQIAQIIQRDVPAGCPILTSAMKDAESPAVKAAEGTASLTVTVILDNSRMQEVQNVLAISTDPGKPYMYQLAKSGNVYVGDIIQGVYDIVAYIKSDNENSQIFLFKEAEDITSTKRLLLNQSQATITCRIGRTSPAGDELSLPTTGDPGNCSIADHLMMLRHKDFGTLLIDETGAFRNVCTHMSTNVIPQRFSITRMDAYTWEQGPAFIVTPVDFEKEYNGPTKDGWKDVSASFAGTPMSDAWIAMQEPPVFAMTGYFITSDRYCNAYVSIGNYNHELLTDQLYYWTPEGYDGYYQYFPVLRDNTIVMGNASMSSMPYRMTADGLVPCGLNLAGSGCLMLDNGKIPATGHPRFSAPLPEDAELGNSVPALVCLPTSAAESGWDNGFLYDYTGRYGEQLGLDSYNYSDVVTADQLNRMGGYHRTLSVTRDGTEICSSPGAFGKWLDWGQGDTYSMQLSMNNVLIDGETEGVNTASLTYKTADGYIPTLTALRLMDDGVVTDRFDKCDRATLELTAATFAYVKPNEFRFEAPSAVKAQYAPHGSDTFTDLTLDEVADNFYLPGYGTYYTAALDNVARESADKWYDLRITVEGKSGAVQTQTLSPAFRLENPASQGGVGLVTGDGRCDVYSADGLIVARGVENINALRLNHGTYIVIKDGKARKIVI